MSSSNCTPSKKLPWVKKMDAKIAHENRMYEAAERVANGGKVNVTLPKGEKKANNLKFADMIEQAKIDKVKRQERDAKKAKQKKEESES